MKIAVIGGTGTIGSAVVEALRENHDVVAVGRTSGELQADMTSRESLRALYRELRPLDGVVTAAGDASFGSLDELSDEDFALGFRSKLMGQINSVREGMEHVADDGSFTLTSGILAAEPTEGSAAISPVNAGVEAFARAAALELPGSRRINVVSPPWIAETLEAMGRDPSAGLPAATVARAYVESVEGERTGEVLDAREFA